MFVQDIPQRIFDEFRDPNEMVIEAKYDDQLGNVEKWQVAHLKCEGTGVICWSESNCFGRFPLSFIWVFMGPIPSDIAKICISQNRDLIGYMLKIRCGPVVKIIQTPFDDPRDSVCVFLKNNGLQLECPLSQPVFKIALRVYELYNSLEVDKRVYTKS